MSSVAATRVLLLGTDNADGTIGGVTTGQSQPQNIPYDSLRMFFLIGIGTLSGGTIVIEEADYKDPALPYTGTWSTIISYPASTFSGGLQLAYHLPPAAYGFVRVRISSNVTGGGSFACSMRSPGSL